jgi:serine/threonine protein kinase
MMTQQGAGLPPSASPDHIPGYRMVRLVGRGGFGAVYEAHQERPARTVAVKIMTVPVDADSTRRFRRESELAGRLGRHPNIVTVFGAGTTSAGRPYVSMEFVGGGSLANRLAAHGPLPVADVLRIGVRIAGALATVHGAGMWHGDVKPENILVSTAGAPVLADFGLARLAVTDEVTLAALTPVHAAPEILDGAAPSAAADVYSLGSTLYELLAGRPAFAAVPGEGLYPSLLRVAGGEVPPIERPDVPVELMTAVRVAMAKRPADRFPDAVGIGEALREVQSRLGLAVTDLPYAPSDGALRISIGEEVPAHVRRRWAIAAVALIVLALALQAWARWPH